MVVYYQLINEELPYLKFENNPPLVIVGLGNDLLALVTSILHLIFSSTLEICKNKTNILLYLLNYLVSELALILICKIIHLIQDYYKPIFDTVSIVPY